MRGDVRRRFAILLAAALVSLGPRSVNAGRERLPNRVGECVATTIKAVGTRLVDGGEPVEGSGSDVEFTNGGRQVSFDTVPQIDGSRPGDPVQMCLLSVPVACPSGDNRGRLYRTTNLRSHQSWVLRDAEHMCGGA